jgi:hypothetical protein
MLPFADVIPQPPIQELSSPEQLNQSLEEYYKVVVKGDANLASLIEGGSSWVDVRDLGLAHVLVLERSRGRRKDLSLSWRVMRRLRSSNRIAY